MANGGVYRSTNGGAQWDSNNTGLDPSSRRIYSLFVAPSGYAFAGTVNGLYRSIQPVTGVGEALKDLATQYTLSQNYPNPFNPSTTIGYGLPMRSRVTLTVYSALGQEVGILQDGEQDAGYHEARFDGAGVASGVYFYRLQAGGFVQTRKLILIR